MEPTLPGRLAKLIAVLVLGLALQACYYVQAARGHLDLMGRREPIDEVVNAGATPEALAERLRLVSRARDFSIRELDLPDNGSYRSYADLERDFVVWNVIAAPEFSLEPKRWCYPVVGCVSYRGYFSKAAAERKARALEADGYDVLLGGVAAYSTLGRFDDPVLNTMMHWENADVVAVMFHELAHQVVYVKDDSAFNESFATAVEEFGLERWLEQTGQPDTLDEYRARRELRQQMMDAIAVARADLEALFSDDLSDAAKRAAKADRLAALAGEIRKQFAAAHRQPPGWLDDINNARLVSMNLYHGRLPEFRQLLADCDDDLACFYERAEALASS